SEVGHDGRRHRSCDEVSRVDHADAVEQAGHGGISSGRTGCTRQKHTATDGAKGGSARQDGDRGDLDDGALAQQASHDDAGRRGGRARGGEGARKAPPRPRGGPPIVLRGRDVLGRLDDVLHGPAGRLEEPLELAEDHARLLDDVATGDDLAAVVRGRGARYEEKVAGPHGGREGGAGGPGTGSGDRLERSHRVSYEVRGAAERSRKRWIL